MSLKLKIAETVEASLKSTFPTSKPRKTKLNPEDKTFQAVVINVPSVDEKELALLNELVSTNKLKLLMRRSGTGLVIGVHNS